MACFSCLLFAELTGPVDQILVFLPGLVEITRLCDNLKHGLREQKVCKLVLRSCSLDTSAHPGSFTRAAQIDPSSVWLLPLHGSLSSAHQQRVFAKYEQIAAHILHSAPLPSLIASACCRAPRGVRKIVVATNIAETSITVDDVRIIAVHAGLQVKGILCCWQVVFVIDSGKMKETQYDPERKVRPQRQSCPEGGFGLSCW